MAHVLHDRGVRDGALPEVGGSPLLWLWRSGRVAASNASEPPSSNVGKKEPNMASMSSGVWSKSAARKNARSHTIVAQRFNNLSPDATAVERTTEDRNTLGMRLSQEQQARVNRPRAARVPVRPHIHTRLRAARRRYKRQDRAPRAPQWTAHPSSPIFAFLVQTCPSSDPWAPPIHRGKDAETGTEGARLPMTRMGARQGRQEATYQETESELHPMPSRPRHARRAHRHKMHRHDLTLDARELHGLSSAESP